MKPLIPVITRAILTSIAVIGTMFMLTYLPQVAVLAVVSGPLGESKHFYLHVSLEA